MSTATFPLYAAAGDVFAPEAADNLVGSVVAFYGRPATVTAATYHPAHPEYLTVTVETRMSTRTDAAADVAPDYRPPTTWPTDTEPDPEEYRLWFLAAGADVQRAVLGHALSDARAAGQCVLANHADLIDRVNALTAQVRGVAARVPRAPTPRPTEAPGAAQEPPLARDRALYAPRRLAGQVTVRRDTLNATEPRTADLIRAGLL